MYRCEWVYSGDNVLGCIVISMHLVYIGVNVFGWIVVYGAVNVLGRNQCIGVGEACKVVRVPSVQVHTRQEAVTVLNVRTSHRQEECCLRCWDGRASNREGTSALLTLKKNLLSAPLS